MLLLPPGGAIERCPQPPETPVGSDQTGYTGKVRIKIMGSRKFEGISLSFTLVAHHE